MRAGKPLFLTVCLTLLSFFLWIFPAQNTHASSFNLKDLIQISLEENAEIQNARLELEKTRSLIKQMKAGRSWRGDLLFDVAHEKTPSYLQSLYSIAGEEPGDAYTTYSGTIALSTVLRDTVENKADLEKLKLLKLENKQELRSLKYSTTEEIMEAAFGYFSAQNGVELAEKALENRKKQLEHKKIEKEEGQITSLELKEAELEVEEAKTTLENARHLKGLARENLFALANIEEAKTKKILLPSLPRPSEIEKANPWPWGLTEMKKIARENNPQIQRSLLGIDLAEIELEKSEANGRFEFNIGGSYTSSENNIRIGLDLSSDYRLTGTVSHFDTSLPEVDGVEISEEEWDDFIQVWEDWYDDDFPDWFPDRENLEEILSQESTPEDEWGIEIGAQINLFDSGLRSAQIEEKEKALKQAQNLKSEAEKGIDMQIRSLFTGLETAYLEARNAELEYQFARQRLSETKIMVEEGLATEMEKELAELGLLRAQNELQEKLFDYELVKLELGGALGLEIDWFLSTLTLE